MTLYLTCPQDLVDILNNKMTLPNKIHFGGTYLEFFVRHDDCTTSITKGFYKGEFWLSCISSNSEKEYEIIDKLADPKLRISLPSNQILELPKISNSVSWISLISRHKDKPELSTRVYINYNANMFMTYHDW